MKPIDASVCSQYGTSGHLCLSLNEVLLVLHLSEEHIASIHTHIASTLKIETLCSIEMLLATYENIG